MLFTQEVLKHMKAFYIAVQKPRLKQFFKERVYWGLNILEDESMITMEESRQAWC